MRAYRVQATSGPADLKAPAEQAWAGLAEDALAVVGLLLILGGGVVGWRLFLHPSWPTSVPPPSRPPRWRCPTSSIAVLPFVNMSGDPEQEYFSDGMTEDLITELSRLSGLFVIARNSVFTYKGKPASRSR